MANTFEADAEAAKQELEKKLAQETAEAAAKTGAKFDKLQAKIDAGDWQNIGADQPQDKKPQDRVAGPAQSDFSGSGVLTTEIRRDARRDVIARGGPRTSHVKAEGTLVRASGHSGVIQSGADPSKSDGRGA